MTGQHHAAAAKSELIKAALGHVQLETIHPFLDGNGRIGRLLISFVLHHGGVLAKPILYLSLYFKQQRAEYYRLLDLVRVEGDWEAWLDFFLEGVKDTASNGRLRHLAISISAQISLFRLLRKALTS